MGKSRTSTFDLENALRVDGYEFIIGIDEAGRGPLAGPVVASAVCLKTLRVSLGHEVSKELDLIKDSKMLSEKQRENIFDFICENFYVGVGICNHETIDRVNILEATYLAAKSAVSDLLRKINQEPRNNNQKNHKTQITNSKQNTNHKTQTSRSIILFDGNKVIPNFSMDQKAIVGGDKIVKSISAASIIAKVTRDRIMQEMHQKYPEYNFAKHKGYGTKAHFEMLQKHGPCEIHRKTFEPVKSLLARRSSLAKKRK